MEEQIIVPEDFPVELTYIMGVIFVLVMLWFAYQLYEAWYGRKCPHCKCRSEKWLQWHQMKEDDFRGWIWCPICFREDWEGFQDRCF